MEEASYTGVRLLLQALQALQFRVVRVAGLKRRKQLHVLQQPFGVGVHGVSGEVTEAHCPKCRRREAKTKTDAT